MNIKDTIPLNAMIVEDEQDLCFLLSLVLIQKNLHPSCVFSIADAKKTIERVNPCVLFLDNRLPDGFGLDFISEVKHDFPAIKIIMISAHNSFQEMQYAKNRGADYFISKPFNSDTIKKTIDIFINDKTR